MSKVIMYAYASILVSANFIFGFILPIHREPRDSTVSVTDWSFPVLSRTVSPDIKELISTGFWGRVDSSLDQTVGSATPKEMAADEAKMLRAQVKAIINRDQKKEVIFGLEKVYHRIKLGDPLPGTQWTLVDVGEDWLKLSKNATSNNIEILKLFTGAGAENSIDAEK